MIDKTTPISEITYNGVAIPIDDIPYWGTPSQAPDTDIDTVTPVSSVEVNGTSVPIADVYSNLSYYSITENDEVVAYAVGDGTNAAITNPNAKKIYIRTTYQGLPVTTINNNAFPSSLSGEKDYNEIIIGPNIVSIKTGNSGGGQGIFSVINYNGRVPATLTGYYADALLQGDVINIHKDVQFVGDALFRNKPIMQKLNTIINFENGSTCTLIGSYAFSQMAITSLNLPNTIETIARGGFYSCNFNVLENLIIPSSVTSIGNSAFYECSGLTSIRFEQSANTTVTLGTEVFKSKTARAITIYTDNATIKDYNWSGDNVTATLLHLDGTAW